MAPDSSSQLRRSLGLRSLTLAVVTSTIGSGWLFAPFYAARAAGAASLLAWLLGGALALALALVFAELGALVTSSGALAQIPLLSHGRSAGFIGGWCAWIAYVSLPTIEVLAMLQYLASSLPWLTADGGAGQVLSGAGLMVAVLLLLAMAWINLAGITWLARWIEGLTAWKLVVPLLVSLTLMLTAGHWGNLGAPLVGTEPASAGAAGSGVVGAIGAGGILFSLLGFRTAMDLAGEARRPQRDVPLAMGLGLGISLAIYLVLQLAFLVAVPPELLAGGWAQLRLTAHGGPLVAVALGLGLGWVVTLLLSDAVISPGATALTYLGVSARVGWMMGRCGLLPAGLGRLNRQAVPAMALLWSLAIGLLLLLGGPSWQRVVSFLTATLVIALAMGPVSLLALRRQLPEEPRAFRLPWAGLWCPLTFVAASWAILWCGRGALEGAVGLLLGPALVFNLVEWRRGRPLQARSGAWWWLYLGGLLAISELIGPGRTLAWSAGGQAAVVAAFALAVFPLAVATRLPHISSDARVELRSAAG
ncbi:APC family permease [Vulcanococcus limneticus Candia 3F8]|uniref:APC family permease n=1 Tax=Vulcanococcus limneticus TaxID=2170428 RepID=UPI000B9860E4|nr:APC family permease [Vulcanococcus limneticus]MCP9791173.1 APC family permease [Vulcanococcus limneticus MW73D5]MCP9893495.1 APC family permease [Vulcanococcus limneticus Candia 3F8]MCP9896571.1 APC family permease [Vulcanococcus limneticus Candia 3B3]